MTYLLDVSTLLARLWRSHIFHERAKIWCDSEKLALCPISELGFLRISTQPPFNATVEDARKMLDAFYRTVKPKFIPCDFPALHTQAPGNGKETTDFYLASLAEKHGMQWATLESQPKHRAAFAIPD